MLNIFNKKYKAISNLFIETAEGDKFTFPAPISLLINIETNETETKNVFEIKVNSVEDSILSLSSSYFSISFFLLTYEYTIDILYIDNILLMSDVQSDMHGYKGTYQFVTNSVSMNIGEDEIYDKYSKLKSDMIEYEVVN